MSNMILVLAPGGNAAAPAPAARFPGQAQQEPVAQPFSSTLDRAVQQAPPRPDQSARATSGRASRSDSPPPADTRSGRREPTRQKNKSNPRDDEPNLAGTCVVNNQPAPVAPVPTLPAETSSEGTAKSVEPAEAAAADADTDAATQTQTPTDGSAQGVESKTSSVAATRLQVALPVSGELEALLRPMSLTANLPPAPKSEAVTAEASRPAATPTVKMPVPIPKDPAMLSSVPALTPRGATSPREADGAKAAAAIALAVGVTPTTQPPEETRAVTALATDASIQASQEVIPATEEPMRVTRAARRALTEAVENVRGTASAKLTETMKTATKQEEIAGLTQQLLPGASLGPMATLPNLPGETRQGTSDGLTSVDPLTAAAKLAPAPTRADLSGAGESRDLRTTPTLARVSEVITREVRMFKRGGDDLVEVVLTPDAKTQISLRLQWREGQVEVQARCDLGDRQSLNQQWPQLQASMAQHGVRLSHLSERSPTGFTEFFNNPSFAQQHERDRQPATAESGVDATSTAATPAGKSGPVKVVARSSRLLESWA